MPGVSLTTYAFRVHIQLETGGSRNQRARLHRSAIRNNEQIQGRSHTSHIKLTDRIVVAGFGRDKYSAQTKSETSFNRYIPSTSQSLQNSNWRLVVAQINARQESHLQQMWIDCWAADCGKAISLSEHAVSTAQQHIHCMKRCFIDVCRLAQPPQPGCHNNADGRG